jgi:hypothetical protein
MIYENRKLRDSGTTNMDGSTDDKTADIRRLAPPPRRQHAFV